MENLEQYLKIAKSVTISTEDYIRFMDLIEEEGARQKDSRLETVKTDNVGVYRVRELKLRGYKQAGDGSWSKFNTKDGTSIFNQYEVHGMTDTSWFSLMDKLDNK